MKNFSNKIAMTWALFAVFTLTAILTLTLGRDCGVLGIVAAAFTITINYLFKVRKDEKIAGVSEPKTPAAPAAPGA